MINLAKQMVLWSLERAGYRLLRKPDHEALLVAAAAPHNRPAPAAAPVAHSAGHGHPSATDLTAALASCDVTLAAFLTDAEDRHRLAPLRAFALYRIAQYLACAGIAGEVVDCGYGATAALAAIAAASVQCGDTSRRLVLFNSSADPLHRAETELELWGVEWDLIANTRVMPRSHKVEPPPLELAATSYPADKIAIRRYPRDPIAQSEPVAFLGLTSEILSCKPGGDSHLPAESIVGRRDRGGREQLPRRCHRIPRPRTPAPAVRAGRGGLPDRRQAVTLIRMRGLDPAHTQ